MYRLFSTQRVFFFVITFLAFLVQAQDLSGPVNQPPIADISTTSPIALVGTQINLNASGV